MELREFENKLKNNNGLPIGDEHILFFDFELYDENKDESVYFKTFDEVLEYELNGKKIKDIISELEKIELIDEGGRGASSSSGSGNGKLFGGARVGGKRVISASGGNSYPAYMNTLVSGRFRSVDKIAKAFGKKTLDATREYSASLDTDGFAHAYAKGNKGSVAHLVKEGGYSIHNHPTKDKNGKTIAWNIFSKQDLKNTALDKAKGTIVVSNGNRTMYKFTKGKRFDSKGFIKGLGTAKSQTGNYDTDVDKWLRANQKKYGYKYNKSKF